jgi:hypothetical protein
MADDREQGHYADRVIAAFILCILASEISNDYP